MNARKVAVMMLTVALSGILPVGVAIADEIYNKIDVSIDATLEVMNVGVGDTGLVSFKVHPTNGDGDNGCNLGSGESATFAVSSDMPGVATVSPSNITFSGPGCDDAPSVTVTGVGAGSATVSLTQTSNTTGGTFDVAPASFTVNVTAAAPVDATAPVITPTVTPAPNGSGWNNTDVTVSWSVTDDESAITSMTGCDTTVLTDETAGTVLTCTATSAGGTASQSVTVKIDKTKPVIIGTQSPLPNGAGWNNTDVAVGFTCAETGVVQSGIATNDVAGATLTTEGAGQSVTNTSSCVDAAGNVADAATISGINIDKTAPVVTITTPASGGNYTYNQTIPASWSTTDALSGVDNALTLSTTANGAPINTTLPLGAKNYTVTATDLAGNTTSVTNTYNVVGYNFNKCYPPLTLDSKDFKKTSTIPVKCQIIDTFGNPISNATLRLKVDGTDAIASGSANYQNFFRYSLSDLFYIYNLSTKMTVLSIGSHTLHILADDGTTHNYPITIK